MSAIGEMLLGGDLSSQCLNEIHDTRRLADPLAADAREKVRPERNCRKSL